mmetsp:Transcript_19042/g.49539  ORF Transcript_19042/g.49539 Transcript_19042/m.49539 type:complete len:382 (-) Transcript_19042:777-1922(-)
MMVGVKHDAFARVDGARRPRPPDKRVETVAVVSGKNRHRVYRRRLVADERHGSGTSVVGDIRARIATGVGVRQRRRGGLKSTRTAEGVPRRGSPAAAFTDACASAGPVALEACSADTELKLTARRRAVDLDRPRLSKLLQVKVLASRRGDGARLRAGLLRDATRSRRPPGNVVHTVRWLAAVRRCPKAGTLVASEGDGRFAVAPVATRLAVVHVHHQLVVVKRWEASRSKIAVGGAFHLTARSTITASVQLHPRIRDQVMAYVDEHLVPLGSAGYNPVRLSGSPLERTQVILVALSVVRQTFNLVYVRARVPRPPREVVVAARRQGSVVGGLSGARRFIALENNGRRVRPSASGGALRSLIVYEHELPFRVPWGIVPEPKR